MSVILMCPDHTTHHTPRTTHHATQQSAYKVFRWTLDDTARAEVPEETYCRGLTIDYTATHPVPNVIAKDEEAGML